MTDLDQWGNNDNDNDNVKNNDSLTVSTKTLDFGDYETGLSFTISNSGSDQINWTVSETVPWLSVNPTYGTITTGTSNVIVEVNREYLDPEPYSSSIIIESNRGSVTINIYMNVPVPILFDTFENLDNWNAVGWALGHTNFEYWDPPYAYCEDHNNNYLSIDIPVTAGQTLSFQLRVWAYSDPDHAVKLYINNVKINTWYGWPSGGNYGPEIELNYNESINIKFVAISSEETSGVPASEARIDNVRIQ